MAGVLISGVLSELDSIKQQDDKRIREEVNKLISILTNIQAVIEDAEIKKAKNKALMLWLVELKDAVYDADDVLDEWKTRSEINAAGSSSSSSSSKNKVPTYWCSPFFCFKDATAARMIEQIRERLEHIFAEQQKYNLLHEEPPQLPTFSLSKPDRFGREEDMESIVSKLFSESRHHQEMHIPIISIVGVSGIGKTTLAQDVLCLDRVETYFEKRMLVVVPEPFDLIGVANAIIKKSEVNAPFINGWDALDYLLKSIKGKRYVLVLDNVLNESPDQWIRLKHSLDGGAPGSRIIVTTCYHRVAEAMGSTYTHQLGQLKDDDCWSLIRQIALGEREEEVPKFSEVGQQIAVKCQGVPLTAISLANLMRHKHTRKDWRRVLSSYIWDAPQMEENFSRSFLMSYNALTSKSKQCLLYLAVFPKNMEIVKADVVKLWMAQGYLGSARSDDLEIVGEECFADLDRCPSFFDHKLDSDGNIISCKMLNLVHDFVLSLTTSECLCSFAKTNDTNFSTQVRHLTTTNMENPSIYSAKKLHSLLRPFGFWQSTFTVPVKLFRQLARLRVLDLSHSAFEKLPVTVGGLIHLRYMDLSYTSLLKLPKTITSLHNLQTLKLNHCRSLQKLPEGIARLRDLRHLEIRRTDDLRYFPLGIGSLIFLRTLHKFIVGGAVSGCKIGELQRLNHLQGKMKIVGLGQVENATEAGGAELKKKENLSRLSLNFRYLRNGDIKTMTSVLENLQPHENLKELKIKCYLGSQFPSWMSNSMLPNLLALELSQCENCTLPALGKMASLEKLTIRKMSMVKHIGQDFYGFDDNGSCTESITFPKLKILQFLGMTEWDKWELPSRGRKTMPCLKDLTIKDCPKLSSLPPLGKLESLETLVIHKLTSVEHIGIEFYGDGCDSYGGEFVAFPKLKKLQISHMGELHKWELPVSVDKKIMPSLCELNLSHCRVLESIPGFGALESLEDLQIDNLCSVEHVGLEFFGITGRTGSGNLVNQEGVFPRLKKLVFASMHSWKEWEVPSVEDTVFFTDQKKKKDTVFLPYLTEVKIENCRKLRAIPDLRKFEYMVTVS